MEPACESWDLFAAMGRPPVAPPAPVAALDAAAPARDAALIAGTYKLVSQLGQGGMGVVHLAERVSDGQRVALKLLRADLAHDVTLSARLRREAQAVRRVEHENVVALLDHGEAGEHGPYLVFEQLTGEALSSRLQLRGRLPAAAALRVIDGVLAALSAAHNRGVVHRDLKPDNVFLEPVPGGEQVKVLDFGISRIVADEAEGGLSRLTRTGLVVGTPAYMAPEQALGEPTQDHRVDVYAAGVVLYEMLSGALPHTGENYNQMLAHLLSQDATPLVERLPAIDTDLAALIHRAIERDPAARFASADAFRQALRDWAGPRVTRVLHETLPALPLAARAADEAPTTTSDARTESPAVDAAGDLCDEATTRFEARASIAAAESFARQNPTTTTASATVLDAPAARTRALRRPPVAARAAAVALCVAVLGAALPHRIRAHGASAAAHSPRAPGATPHAGAPAHDALASDSPAVCEPPASAVAATRAPVTAPAEAPVAAMEPPARTPATTNPSAAPVLAHASAPTPAEAANVGSALAVHAAPTVARPRPAARPRAAASADRGAHAQVPTAAPATAANAPAQITLE